MDKTIRIKYRMHLQKAGDTYLAITVGDDAERFPDVLYLNESGAFIFEQLQQSTTRSAILSRMIDEYDADETVLAQDLDAVLNYIEQTGALESD